MTAICRPTHCAQRRRRYLLIALWLTQFMRDGSVEASRSAFEISSYLMWPYARLFDSGGSRPGQDVRQIRVKRQLPLKLTAGARRHCPTPTRPLGRHRRSEAGPNSSCVGVEIGLRSFTIGHIGTLRDSLIDSVMHSCWSRWARRISSTLANALAVAAPITLTSAPHLDDVASFSAFSACSTDEIETRHVLLAMFATLSAPAKRSGYRRGSPCRPS